MKINHEATKYFQYRKSFGRRFPASFREYSCTFVAKILFRIFKDHKTILQTGER
jgi:hypothetical protein